MLQVCSALKGYTIEAKDGKIGSVSDFLFDDARWKMRWLIVDTGQWLTERRVLVHPSVVGRADYERLTLPVGLTRAEIEGSPEIRRDQPFSAEIEQSLYDYYRCNAVWGQNYFAGGGGEEGRDPPAPPPPFIASEAAPEAAASDIPYLRSVDVLTGFHLAATDGEIGHVTDLLIDDESWDVRYLVVDTRNWLPGRQVLISPYAVKAIDWDEEIIHLDLARGQVEASPPWNLEEMLGKTYPQRREAYERRLHHHYGWPGYEWF